MSATIAEVEDVQTLTIRKELMIAAPIEIAFEAVLEQIGSDNQMPDGSPYPLKLEQWPGGRWYRDLGNNTGHLWGHVQVIKPSKLLELYGPMFMSFPAMSHSAYRIAEAGSGCKLVFTYRAHGLFPKEFGEGVEEGWGQMIEKIRSKALQKAKR